MNLLDPTLWALWCGCLLLLMAASVNARTLRVPNQLTLPALLSGLLLALVIGSSTGTPTHGGGLVPSLGAAIVGLLLLVPFYANHGLGAGCVKMQMAFGAWAGCALGLRAAVLVTGLATVVGVLLTTIAASLFVATHRLRPYMEQTYDAYLFPAQITLSLGSICGVILAGVLGWL